jgi:hypothetical protein
MDPTLFVATIRAWAEDMEGRRYGDAYRRALDLQAVGQPLTEGLPLADERFGLNGWRDRKPEELLDGLVGFLLAVSSSADAGP